MCEFIKGRYYQDKLGVRVLVYVGERNSQLLTFHATGYNEGTGNIDETDEEIYLTHREAEKLQEA